MECNDAPTECGFVFNHDAKGSATLRQTITSFGGVKLSKGSLLTLSAILEFYGAPNLTMRLKVTYTDGTTDTRKATLAPLRTTSTAYPITSPLALQKKVAKIVVELKDTSKDGEWVRVDNVKLRIEQPLSVQFKALDAAPVLPLPDAPK
jgi:hypothetical protein